MIPQFKCSKGCLAETVTYGDNCSQLHPFLCADSACQCQFLHKKCSRIPVSCFTRVFQRVQTGLLEHQLSKIMKLMTQLKEMVFSLESKANQLVEVLAGGSFGQRQRLLRLVDQNNLQSLRCYYLENFAHLVDAQSMDDKESMDILQGMSSRLANATQSVSSLLCAYFQQQTHRIVKTVKNRAEFNNQMRRMPTELKINQKLTVPTTAKDIEASLGKSQLLDAKDETNNKAEGKTKVVAHSLSQLPLPDQKLQWTQFMLTDHRNLKELHLERCAIQSLQFLRTMHTPSLQILVLNDNKISRLDELKQCNVPLLKCLFLDFNKVTDLNTFIQHQFPQLETLSLCHNLIRSAAPIRAIKSKKLKYLYLIRNPIENTAVAAEYLSFSIRFF